MKENRTALTQQQRRKRTFLLVLPVFVVPFFTLLLWSLGILGSNDVLAATKGGLNAQLPDAQLKENSAWNKLSFYEQADKDSLRFRDEIKSDPTLQIYTDSIAGIGNLSYNPLLQTYQDVNEARVNQKLTQLNAALSSNQNTAQYERSYQPNQTQTPAIKTEDVNRLEKMLQSVNEPDSERDPETEQLTGMMDKILDIQHPDHIKERLQQESITNKKAAYPVMLHPDESHISLLENNKRKPSAATSRNAFYSLSNDTSAEQKDNTFSATVYQTQTVTDGSLLKLITQSDIYVNGILIPQGNFIYAMVSFATQRLNLAVSSIRYQNQILPVELMVYDGDGLAGIHITSIQKNDVARQSGTEAISNLDMASLDPSIGMQAATAGIAATKALLNKKVKTIKVTVPVGYKVFLKSNLN